MFRILSIFVVLIFVLASAQAQSITDNMPQVTGDSAAEETAAPPQPAAPTAPPAPAADPYTISDVNADVTADTAAHARDQALMQAERTAFIQLCAKMNVPDSATKIDDDSLAALVQSFEVQSERLSAVRYIGVFTIRFKQTALQKKIGKYMSATADNTATGEDNKLMPAGTVAHVPIAVQTDSLAGWTQIKKRINAVPTVARVDVVTLGRGASHIDVSYAGSLTDLQQALTAQGLVLRQNPAGVWELYDGSMTR